MHKYFVFHILLPAQLSFGSRCNLRYSLGAYPTYSCSHCWASRTTSSATGQPNLVWAINFPGKSAFWHVGSTWSGTSYHKSCRRGNKKKRWPQTAALRGRPPGCCLPLAGAVCHLHVTVWSISCHIPASWQVCYIATTSRGSTPCGLFL